VPALVAGIIVLLAGGGGLAYTLTRHKTADPSPIPTVAPSSGPSDQPSFEPSDEPSAEPSDEPTSDPGAGSIPLGHYTCQQFVVGTGYFPMPPLELSAGTYTNGGSGSWHAEGNRMVPTSGPWADDGWSGTYSDHDATGAAVPTINVDNPDGLRIHCFK
jgi:hypothetical protein